MAKEEADNVMDISCKDVSFSYQKDKEVLHHITLMVEEGKATGLIGANGAGKSQDSDSQLFLSTVYEDVAFGPRNYGCSEKETAQRVMEALRKVHIEDLKERQIYRMSGGQKKLAAIATILSMQPEIVLLDEPSIALDPRNRRNLIHILNEMPETKMIASHDLDMILDTCESVILLAEGRIVCQGETESILRDKELLEQYGLELPLCLQGRG
jgi:cobalt/nickel transport system ATP-binding protein